MKNKGFKISMILFIIFFIADIVTTLWNFNLLPYLEANPLYKYMGIVGIIIANILMMYLIYWLYTRKNATYSSKFYIICIIFTVILGRIYALRNNIHWIMNPITIEQAKIISTEATKAATMTGLMFAQYIPLIFALVVFYIWKIDHKIEIKK